MPATASPVDGDGKRHGDQSETRSPARNVGLPTAAASAVPMSRHGLDVAKLVRHRVQSLRRNASAEQRKLVAFLVRGVVEDSLVEGGEFRREARMIHSETLQVEDRPSGSFLFRRARRSDQVAAALGVVAGDRVHDRLLTEFVRAHQHREVTEEPLLIVTGRRAHLYTQLSELSMLVQ